VTTTETERSKKLAEVLVKKLTGETEITAKFMRQDFFTYRNQAAVWLATNYKRPSSREATSPSGAESS